MTTLQAKFAKILQIYHVKKAVCSRMMPVRLNPETLSKTNNERQMGRIYNTLLPRSNNIKK
jgi:hypothetical protein